MHKYPDINQFRHAVEAVTHRATYTGQSADDQPVYDETRAKPTLQFKGHVKLHGTNAGVGFDLVAGVHYAQSRERVLSLANDHDEFCAFVQSPAGALAMEALRRAALGMAFLGYLTDFTNITVYGEWCGDRVNGKTAIGQLPARWVIFDVAVIKEDASRTWLTETQMVMLAEMWRFEHFPGKAELYFITDYPSYTIDIDFNDPGASLAQLEALTLEVEASCPVAHAMGQEGIGEGVVWECTDPVYGRICFKTKGLKHKGTRNKRLVDIAPEVLASQAAFVDAVLTESRLEQGFDLVKAQYGKVTLDRMGDFLMWVGKDVMKEESDSMVASGLDRKQLMGVINKHAKAWALPRLAQF